jgi:hypothetical protein
MERDQPASSSPSYDDAMVGSVDGDEDDHNIKLKQLSDRDRGIRHYRAYATWTWATWIHVCIYTYPLVPHYTYMGISLLGRSHGHVGGLSLHGI